jgi:hypothetical protein
LGHYFSPAVRCLSLCCSKQQNVISTGLRRDLRRVAKEDECSISDWIVVTLQEAIAKRDHKRR